MNRIAFATLLSLFLVHCDGSERVHYFLDMRNSPAVDSQEPDFIGNRKGNLACQKTRSPMEKCLIGYKRPSTWEK